MLTDDVKAEIQSAYSKFLSKKDYKSRYGQRQMIAEFARYLGGIESDSKGIRKSKHKVCVVEAGTGTGKTLGYCISAIPLALSHNKKLIISTATTALQEQIVAKDLPDIVNNSGLKFKFALAKGRGRYLCLSKLETQLANDGSVQDSLPLFMLDNGLGSPDNKPLYQNMFSAYANQQWDGDRDKWPDNVENKAWSLVTTDNQQCSNRRCSYFHSCSYYESRKLLEDADVIVANHDLILADLSLGGGVVLPAPEDAIYVFDEAHHLADKALGHFAVHSPLKGCQNWLKQTSKVFTELLPYIKPSSRLRTKAEEITTLTPSIHDQIEALYLRMEQSLDWNASDDRYGQRPSPMGQQRDNQIVYRFAEGVVPDELKSISSELLKLFIGLCRLVDEINNDIIRSMDEKPDASLSKEDGESWFPVIGSTLSRGQSYQDLWRFFSTDDIKGQPPSARWAVKKVFDNFEDIELFGSPLMADSLLYSRLWSKCYAALITSATLTSLGNFNRLTNKSGLPDESAYLAVTSPFNYGEVATLRLPSMKSDPGNSVAHTEELIELFPQFLEGHQGTLALFSSRKQMNEVLDGLPTALRTQTISQDEMSKQEVIKEHKRKIDEGETSVIFGLASFAEGIDLPGDYLTNVLIAKIPFAVPNDPIEAGLSEWIESRGGNPFMEITVPEASTKLIQACGRLLRAESDYGQVTLFDSRLVNRRYGKMIIDSLPPFKRRYD
ncbi:ATP-dependent DNA helicase DinG [Alkalimarinus alittae]|uniref:ATP-dependent DNA helicase DinG n=1 Tax=Alkalimarinus alittae TaxID=2961619 RepID=A0ABY6N6V0_9ALTE|nr:ATP-dependent DNA helicase DinG [Alkalimarinus alittae]UZE97821.1 ATP-dependent DNA helicase DinG [Alkalimarinus alittae]